jgi:hypothetical protein
LKLLYTLCGEDVADKDFLDIGGLDTGALNGSYIELLAQVIVQMARRVHTLDGVGAQLDSTQAREGAVVA